VVSSTQPVLLGGSLTVQPNATDATSGVASSSCTVPDTTTVGSKTVTCTATDQAGNTQSVSVPYSVAYPFRGFLSPVDTLPMVNTVKAGSSVPVKFSLGGNRGLNVLATGYPRAVLVPCDSGSPADEIEQTVTANAGLTYDAVTDTYTYVWKTSRTPGCVRLEVRLVDGTDHLALFRLR